MLNNIDIIKSSVMRYSSYEEITKMAKKNLKLYDDFRLNKLMDIMELAGELDKRAPYDKIVTKEYE